MRLLNIISFVVILLFLVSCSPKVSDKDTLEVFPTLSLKNFQSLSPDEFEEYMTRDDVIVLDLRTPEELKDLGVLEDMDLHLDVYDDSFGEKFNFLDKNVSYALYCYHGTRSGELMSIMKSQGFLRVNDLDGGITAWIDENKSVVTR